MNEKFYALLGFAVKAGKVKFGHDSVKHSLVSGKSRALLFCTDASPRLREELTGLAGDIPVIELGLTSERSRRRYSRPAAVLSVNDRGFADSLYKMTFPEENKEETVCP